MRSFVRGLQFDKLTIVILLMTALVLGIVLGISNSRVSLAQDGAAQTFVVLAGAGFASVNTDVLAFVPGEVNVHRGDTVMWTFGGFHNVRFTDDGPLPAFLLPEVDDVEVPQMNPDILFLNFENGATLSAMGANSGLFFPPGYSLVIDLEPGTYSYVCDLHPGMAGVINVVDDSAPVASPIDVIGQGNRELDARVEAAYDFVEDMLAGGTVATAVDGVAHIQADVNGSAMGISVQQFFPATAVINIGESVTWTVPEGSAGTHTVTWPPQRGEDLAEMVERDDGSLILALGPGYLTIAPENGQVGQGDAFNSGIIRPGETFTLTFIEPGAYPFFSSGNPAMHGTVVVLPAE